MSATAASLGLERDAEPGAARVVRAMLREGLPLDLIPFACRLAVELEEVCHEQRAEAASPSRSNRRVAA
jgi:hypothetical protein